MAVIKKSEIKKLSVADAEKKITELEMAMLESEGKGEREKLKPLRKAIAKLKTHIWNEKRKEKAAEAKEGKNVSA